MPASLELQRQLGDDLQVIFIEVQGATLDKAAAFALKRRWIGTRAMWTNEVITPPRSYSLPGFVLLGNEGQVLMRGSPLSKKKQIEKAIAGQIALTRQPPEGTPPAFLAGWDLAARGNFAAALDQVESVVNSADDPALSAAADAIVKAIEERAAGRLERVRETIASGEFGLAEERLNRAAEGAEGNAKLESEVALARAELESDEFASERTAATELAEIQGKMVSGNPRAQIEALRGIVAEHAGTRAADLAARYLKLLNTRV